MNLNGAIAFKPKFHPIHRASLPNRTTYLDMTINQPIQFDIIVVFAEWIDEDLSYFQPTDVEAKLWKQIEDNN